MNIPELIKEAHDNAIERGFYDCGECKGSGEYFQKTPDCRNCGVCPEHSDISVEICTVPSKCPVCNGYKTNPNKNIGELLMLIVSELGEALEAHRCGRFVHDGRIDIWTDEGRERILNAYCFSWEDFENEIKDTFEDEIADVFIRLFDLCGYLEIEIKTYPDLEMQCFENIGQEFLWWTATLSNLPGFIEYYKVSDDIKKEIQDISLTIKRMEIFCDHHNIPIEKHIKAKMAYNRTRPRKHGKEY